MLRRILAVLIITAMLPPVCAQQPDWRLPKGELMPPPPPPLSEVAEYLEAYDVQVLVLDAEKQLPLAVRMEIVGWPQQFLDWWLVVRTDGSKRPTLIRFSAPGFRSMVRSLTPGVHVVQMTRIRKV
jgi:hypothetical protein